MITSIQFKDFRGIHQGGVDRFRRFNLFVGPNNAGKTTLLEALYLVGVARREAGLVIQNRVYEVRVPDRDFLGYEPLRRVCARHGLAEQRPEIARWDAGQLRVEVKDRRAALRSFTLDTEGGFAAGEEQQIALLGLSPTTQNLEQGAELLVREIVGQGALPFEDKNLFFCWHPDLTYYQQGSAAWITQGDGPPAQHVLFHDVDAVQSYLPLDFYQQMLSAIPGWSHQIAHRFGQVFGIEEPYGVQFLPPLGQGGGWEQGWIAPQKRPAMPIDVYGDGARAAFKLLTPLIALAELSTAEEPGLALWEEPELFQHPQTLGRLLGTVVEIVQDRPIQVFISTQSLEVVAYFTEMLRRGRLGEADVMVFRLALQDGALQSTWFDAGNLAAWLENGRDPRVWGEFAGPLYCALWEESQ